MAAAATGTTTTNGPSQQTHNHDRDGRRCRRARSAERVWFFDMHDPMRRECFGRAIEVRHDEGRWYARAAKAGSYQRKYLGSRSTKRRTSSGSAAYSWTRPQPTQTNVFSRVM